MLIVIILLVIAHITAIVFKEIKSKEKPRLVVNQVARKIKEWLLRRRRWTVKHHDGRTTAYTKFLKK